MEIHRLCCYILINCVLYFLSCHGKPVSLNDLIAAEEKSTSLQTHQLKVSEYYAVIIQRTKLNANTKSFGFGDNDNGISPFPHFNNHTNHVESKTTYTRELPKKYKIFTLSKHMTSGSTAHPGNKISPLNYRKTFQIRTPLKPKKIKYSLKPRYRRISSATKREIDNDETFNRNYIPLLKSLSVLFNNILHSDSGGDDDTDEHYNKQQSISRSEECTCARKSDYGTPERKPTKKATPITPFITSTFPTKAKTIDLTEASSSSTYHTFNDNISPLRRNKNVPVLSARDSISSRRNHNGFGERSLSAYNRNVEGHIARNNGSDENNNSRRQATDPYTENYNEYPNSSSGDDPSCNGDCGEFGGNRYFTSNTTNETSTIETVIGSNETFGNDRGDSNQYKGHNQFKTGRNKTESRILLLQSSSRLRRFQSQEETTEILWQIESPKESSFDVTYNFTRNQRLSNRNGSVAPEDQEIRRTNQKLTLDDLTRTLINASRLNSTNNKDKQKIVVIYDGYSIARDVNGENKFTEKAYRILS